MFPLIFQDHPNSLRVIFRAGDSDPAALGVRSGPRKTGPEGGAGRGGDQNFGISTFFIKGTPLKMRAGRFLFYASF